MVGFDEYDRAFSKSSRWLARLSTWGWPPQYWIPSILTLDNNTLIELSSQGIHMMIKRAFTEIPCLERDSEYYT